MLQVVKRRRQTSERSLRAGMMRFAVNRREQRKNFQILPLLSRQVFAVFAWLFHAVILAWAAEITLIKVKGEEYYSAPGSTRGY